MEVHGKGMKQGTGNLNAPIKVNDVEGLQDIYYDLMQRKTYQDANL